MPRGLHLTPAAQGGGGRIPQAGGLTQDQSATRVSLEWSWPPRPKEEGKKSPLTLGPPDKDSQEVKELGAGHFHELPEASLGGIIRTRRRLDVSRLLLPTLGPASVPPTPQPPPTITMFVLWVPQNISLRQQHHWGTADPNFTSRYAVA